MLPRKTAFVLRDALRFVTWIFSEHPAHAAMLPTFLKDPRS
jgi:hypothetical protein